MAANAMRPEKRLDIRLEIPVHRPSISHGEQSQDGQQDGFLEFHFVSVSAEKRIRKFV